MLTAADWPQWRGPNRDGLAGKINAPSVWPKELKLLWKAEVGEGHASPVLAGGKLYAFSRQNDDEVLCCLDASSGKELWRQAYAAPYTMNPAAVSHGKGPKSTPTLSGRNVYTLGISGILSCWDAASGALRWRHEFSKSYPKTLPLYGAAMSPLCSNGLCIAHVGGHGEGALTAFDAESGAVKWSWKGDGPGYASPVVAALAGVEQVVTQTQNHLVGVSLTDGQTLWESDFHTEYSQNAITPVIYKDLVVYTGIGHPLIARRVKKGGGIFSTDEVWRNVDGTSYLSTPIAVGSRILGLNTRKAGQLYCLDADTGKTIWQNDGRTGEYASLIGAGDRVFVLTARGELLVLPAVSDRYNVAGRYRISSSPTWAHLAISDDRIWVKDKTHIISLKW
jgi:hypothetical protein